MSYSKAVKASANLASIKESQTVTAVFVTVTEVLVLSTHPGRELGGSSGSASQASFFLQKLRKW